MDYTDLRKHTGFLPDTFHLARTQIPGLPANSVSKYLEFSGNPYSEDTSHCFYWVTSLEIHLTKPNLSKMNIIKSQCA